MTSLKRLAWIVLAAVLVPAVRAETHCPGNVASVPLRLVNSYQMIVAVTINHSGPYDFLLDTGAQFTMVDPSLAADLHLGTKGLVPVAGTGFQTTSSVVQLDRLQVGPYAVARLEALEFNVQNIRPYNPSVRGILGEDFLQEFDMLIDNAHRVLCLDSSTILRSEVRGSRIALETASETERVPANSLILAVRLSDGTRPIRLKLDSGANAPVLYDAAQFKPIELFMAGSLRGTGANGLQISYIALPPQDVKIGRLQLTNIPFFAPAGSANISKPSDFDGLLPLRLFQRAFICRGEECAILEAR
jgi:aspartyl protease